MATFPQGEIVFTSLEWPATEKFYFVIAMTINISISANKPSPCHLSKAAPAAEKCDQFGEHLKYLPLEIRGRKS